MLPDFGTVKRILLFSLFFLNETVRAQVIDACASYTISSDGSTSLCKECKDGFQVTDDMKRCLRCPLGCLKCKTSGECVTCKEGTYLDKGDCISCTSSCVECEKGVCTRCAKDFSLVPDLTCISCSLNCQSCIATNNCTKCYSGFKTVKAIDDSIICEIDRSITKFEGWTLAIIFIIIVLVFVCCCCALAGFFYEAGHSTRFGGGRTYEEYKDDIVESRISAGGSDAASGRSLSKKRSKTPNFEKMSNQPLLNVESPKHDPKESVILTNPPTTKFQLELAQKLQLMKQKP